MDVPYAQSLLSSGRSQVALLENLQKRVLPMFVGHVLPFDLACTSAYAQVLALARKACSGIQSADACITAVAFANGFSVTRRDTGPLQAAGLPVISPRRTRNLRHAIRTEHRITEVQAASPRAIPIS